MLYGRISNNLIDVLSPENPNCLQTTLASSSPQWSLHTLPHVPFTQTSTFPSSKEWPRGINWTSPSMQIAREKEIMS